MTKAAAKPIDWAQLRKQAKPRTRKVALCLDGELLAALAQDPDDTKAADRVRKASVDFTVQGLTRAQFKKLEAEHPGDDGQGWGDNFPDELIRACLVDPTPPPAPEPVGDLFTVGEFEKLFEAAFLACNEVDALPLVGSA